MKTFKKILVANRGEIAVRVIRTIHQLGLSAIAIYSEADRNTRHTQLADISVCVGPATLAQSYLNIENIINAARQTGADAIHPGYGFLSENPEFAARCEEQGIVFIGPPQSAIKLMASKQQSKLAMIEAGVPIIPGYNGDQQDDQKLLDEAIKIGFPLMIKASAGGGGKGIRLVNDKSDLVQQLKLARSESLKAFANDHLILERAIQNARHIEIQIFADNHGNVIHLGERDCSIQRRHQKMFEEAPSVAITDEIRNKMGEVAIQVARACDYRGAGTVEFLFENDNHFYFLEMNTRLQVEHPVTEMISGIDLVAWQIQIAQGEPLPLQQNQVKLAGHAIEVRLNAEDPDNQFLPQSGQVKYARFSADNRHVRTDSGVANEQHITTHYDSLLAKLIAHGSTREKARIRLINQLENSTLLGLKTNKHYLIKLLNDERYISGNFDTQFIAKLADASEQDNSNDIKQQTNEKGPRCKREQTEPMIAAVLLLLSQQQKTSYLPYWQFWHSGGQSDSTFNLKSASGSEFCITLSVVRQSFDEQNNQRNGIANSNLYQFVAKHNDLDSTADSKIVLISIDDNQCTIKVDSDLTNTYFYVDGNTIHMDSDFGINTYQETSFRTTESESHDSNEIVAVMDGTISSITVNTNDNVKKGQVILTMEAMKMEMPLKAKCNGKIAKIAVNVGQQVKTQQLLVSIEE